MKNNKRAPKISYEPEADVLMWEISKQPIDSAKEIGNVIVHFSKNQNPVLLEILDASKFLSQAKNLVVKRSAPLHKTALGVR